MAGPIVVFTHPFLAALLLIAGSVTFVWQLYDARWGWKGTVSIICFYFFLIAFSSWFNNRWGDDVVCDWPYFVSH